MEEVHVPLSIVERGSEMHRGPCLSLALFESRNGGGLCPSSDRARLFLRVIVSNESGPSLLGLPGAHSWVVKSRHQSGDLLKAEDLLPSSKGGASTPSYRGPAPTGPFRLRVLKPLAPGDTVPETAVRLERKVLKAQASLSAKLRLPIRS